ncbi:hypothetical protein AB8880_08335 [Alphaproteobacteria bacterium LSUCC0684]
MKLKNGAITEQDIDFIRNTSRNPINLKDLPSHPILKDPIQLIKFTSILSIVREREKIAKIIDAVSEYPESRNAAALEILLYNANSPINDTGDLPKDLSVCLDLFFNQRKVCRSELMEISIYCRLQLIKFAALNNRQDLVNNIYSASSGVEREFLANFLVSLARFSATFSDRLSANIDLDRWASYCQIIAQSVCFSDANNKNFLYACMALLVAQNGGLAEAEKIIKNHNVKDKLVNYSISMRRSLSSGDFNAAISSADCMLPYVSPNVGVSEFSREIAEYSLRRVNDVLVAAGLQPFLISGTLLGCVREGRIFNHDKDFDIGIFGWESQYDVAAALLKSGEFNFSTKDLRGNKLFLLPVRHKDTGFDFDIFFFHDRDDHFLHGIDSRIGYTINYKFSKFDLISRSFMGNNYFIPSNYEKMLSENYGSTWNIPDPFYFVKLQSPALVKQNEALFGFVARHEMIDLIQKGGSLEKGNALIKCIRRSVQKEFQPSEETFSKFLLILESVAV